MTSSAAPAIRRLDSEVRRLPVPDPAAHPGDEWAEGAPAAARRRPSPELIAALAILAGVGAIALGAAAAVVESSSDTGAPSLSVAQSGLALLSKPSTERVPFAGSHGTAVLAVGSGGRAAIVLRGFAPAATDAYDVWASAPGRPFVRVGTFTGAERLVLLSARLERGSVVGIVPREAGPPTASSPPSLVAERPEVARGAS